MDGAFKLRQLALSINLLAVYGVNIISYLSSLLAINFSQSNFKLIAEQAEENEQLQDKLRHDPMTGLLNHEAFYDELGDVYDDYHNNNVEFSVAVLDIDDFKNLCTTRSIILFQRIKSVSEFCYSYRYNRNTRYRRIQL